MRANSIDTTESKGDGKWDSLPQELFQVLPWRVYDQPVELYCARGTTLLQAPPRPTYQGKGQLEPA